jgi:hypothetical protein
VRRFRLQFFSASKRNEAKRDPFRFVFACSSEIKGPIFSLVFASFRFEFFALKQNEKKFASFRFRNFLFASFFCCHKNMNSCVSISVAEPHHFYAAPAPGKNFDEASAPAAPAPTLLYSKAKFIKRTKVKAYCMLLKCLYDLHC